MCVGTCAAAERYQKSYQILSRFLGDWCSFVLVSNHAFVRFIHSNEGRIYFCLFRLTWLSTSTLVMRIGFMNTPLDLRLQVGVFRCTLCVCSVRAVSKRKRNEGCMASEWVYLSRTCGYDAAFS